MRGTAMAAVPTSVSLCPKPDEVFLPNLYNPLDPVSPAAAIVVDTPPTRRSRKELSNDEHD